VNPLQYVISFNPPLTIHNLSMMPLEVYEIDDPDAEEPIEKLTA